MKDDHFWEMSHHNLKIVLIVSSSFAHPGGFRWPRRGLGNTWRCQWGQAFISPIVFPPGGHSSGPQFLQVGLVAGGGTLFVSVDSFAGLGRIRSRFSGIKRWKSLGRLRENSDYPMQRKLLSMMNWMVEQGRNRRSSVWLVHFGQFVHIVIIHFWTWWRNSGGRWMVCSMRY